MLSVLGNWGEHLFEVVRRRGQRSRACIIVYGKFGGDAKITFTSKHSLIDYTYKLKRNGPIWTVLDLIETPKLGPKSSVFLSSSRLLITTTLRNTKIDLGEKICESS